jgi:hypothetical protein
LERSGGDHLDREQPRDHLDAVGDQKGQHADHDAEHTGPDGQQGRPTDPLEAFP